MAINIDINYIRTIGERGSGDGQFEFPLGLSSVGQSFYVCDSQNGRIQTIGLEGNPINSFGSTIIDNPFGVIYESGIVYVSSKDNHKICRFTTSGNYLDSFGTQGTGDTNFDYPCGIAISGDNIYIADRGNDRVVVRNKTTGAYVSQISGLTLPENLAIIDGYIYVQYGNDTIKQYTLAGSFVREVSIHECIINGIKSIQGVLFITDISQNRILCYDDELSYLTQFQGFDYPCDIEDISNNILLISQPHEVFVYTLKVDLGLEYIEEFSAMNRELYPTGRAWWKPKGSVFEKLHEALVIQESKVASEIIDIQYNFFADSTLISDSAISQWMSIFGIVSNGTRDDKIALIKQAQCYPNGVFARQSSSFIENQLQIAGFDVYLHYNPTHNPNAAVYGLQTYGSSVYAEEGDTFTVVANNVDEALDSSFQIANGTTNLFYIGGAVFGDYVDMPIERKNEFRELVLRLKPAHSVAVLYINYV